jgi:hypothetical protein
MSPAVIDYAIKMFCCVFAVAAFIYVFLPSRDTETGVAKTRVTYLYERKEVVYENLRDLNFEFKSGKFAQDDYDGMRIGLEAEAARIMAEIDVLESAAKA